jgi:hypothetical protein
LLSTKETRSTNKKAQSRGRGGERRARSKEQGDPKPISDGVHCPHPLFNCLQTQAQIAEGQRNS